MQNVPAGRPPDLSLVSVSSHRTSAPTFSAWLTSGIADSWFLTTTTGAYCFFRGGAVTYSRTLATGRNGDFRNPFFWDAGRDANLRHSAPRAGGRDSAFHGSTWSIANSKLRSG